MARLHHRSSGSLIQLPPFSFWGKGRQLLLAPLSPEFTELIMPVNKPFIMIRNTQWHFYVTLPRGLDPWYAN